MGRLIFNSEMGIVGVQGRIAHSVSYHPKGTAAGKRVHYGGAYSRRDLLGCANVLCKYPNALFGKEPTPLQRQNRVHFADTIAALATIMADPDQVAIYRAQFKAQHTYLTLRGYIFSRIYSTT